MQQIKVHSLMNQCLALSSLLIMWNWLKRLLKLQQHKHLLNNKSHKMIRRNQMRKIQIVKRRNKHIIEILMDHLLVKLLPLWKTFVRSHSWMQNLEWLKACIYVQWWLHLKHMAKSMESSISVEVESSKKKFKKVPTISLSIL